MNITVTLDNYRTIVPVDDVQNIRSIIVNVITENINYRRLNQQAAADLLRIDQPKVSHLKNKRTEGFSLERLLRLLTMLEFHINISIDNMSNK